MDKCKTKHPSESSFSIKDYHNDSKLFPETHHRRNNSNNIYFEGRKALLSSAATKNRADMQLKQTN